MPIDVLIYGTAIQRTYQNIEYFHILLCYALIQCGINALTSGRKSVDENRF